MSVIQTSRIIETQPVEPVGEFDAFKQQPGSADYTLTLGNLIWLGYDTPEKLHLSSEFYPIFDESYRKKLNRKIVQHFCMREIGQETIQQFVFYLGRTLDEQMPYYNQLYLSTLKKFEPLSTMDANVLSDTKNVSQSSGKNSETVHNVVSEQSDLTTSDDTTGTTVNNDTPMTMLEDFKKYAANASQNEGHNTGVHKGNTTTTTDGNTQSSTDFTHSDDSGNASSRSTGYSGVSASQLITEWRSQMINVDMMVCDNLEDCFMQIFGSSDDMNLRQVRVQWPYIGGTQWRI